ncbi:Zn-ribbon domain-containing OB-fold protein [Pseudorhodoferax sp.]|uniref:Zn-ribbon domain-containing OB-fold protein n=1 Tax=Pseudorhodoferax sp. TaxID=1993553 RepID=UPI002DD6971D|nr:OB-fold domain-containing protein [Pseudorhodoferax sp.]
MSAIAYVDGWPQPYPLPAAEPYWQALQQQRLTYQHCTACSQTVWPAHSHCPHCGRQTLEWRESSGRGTVYSFSTVMRGPTPAWQAIVPYTVGFVRMAEGHYLFTQIEGDPKTIAIGQPVAVRFVQRGDQTLPVFAGE